MSHQRRSRCKTRIPAQPLHDSVIENLMHDFERSQARRNGQAAPTPEPARPYKRRVVIEPD